MESSYNGRTVNKQLLLNSWQIGAGTNTNFTQSLQNPLMNVRALHFMSFIMPNMIRPFTTTDNKFFFYLNGNTTVQNSVTISPQVYFFSIAGFITYMNALFVSSGFPQLTFTQSNTLASGYGNLVLTLNASSGTVAPVGFNENIPALEGNFKIGYALPSYPFSNTVVADGFPNVLQRTNSIRLQTNLTSTTHSANRDYNTTFTIPVGVNPGNMIVFNNPYRIDFPTSLPSVASVSIKMVDDDGIELNIPDNAYMSCVLGVECDE